MSAGAFMNGGSDLPHILASLRALLTPTEQLPGQQSASQNLLLTVPQQQHAMPAAQGGGGAPSGSGGASSLLSNGNTLSKLVSLLGDPSLAAYASGAPADAAVSSALGSVGAQTAPTAASIQAGNEAALAGTDGGAAGAGAGLVSMSGLGSGAAADAAVTGELGSVGAQTAGESAAIQAANGAALGGSGTAASAAPSALSSAGYAMAGPAAFAAMYGLGNELNAMFTGQNNNYSIGQINDMLSGVKKNAASTLTPAMVNGPAGGINFMNPNGTPNQSLYNALTQLNQMQLGDFGQATPYVQQQLAGMGFSPVLAAMQPIPMAPSSGAGRLLQKV